MVSNGEGYSVEDLRQGLRRFQEDDVGIVAVLWTWLESHLLTLGSLEDKLPSIRRAAAAVPYTGIDDAVLAWLDQSPLRNAAQLLAQIGILFESRDEGLTEVKKGLGEVEVIVAARRPALAIAMHDSEAPPSSVEHPSLSTLAPRLNVCPLRVNGIELHIQDAEGWAWDLVIGPLEKNREDPSPGSLSVHLDTLGEHGLSGWNCSEERGTGLYDPAKISESDDESLCIKAAVHAVEEASGPASILVMPELAAPPSVLSAIATALEDHSEAPLMTVVGAYHRVPDVPETFDPALLGEAKVAEQVNEALVFGPNGSELWSQRKMSYAGGGAAKQEERFVEDIQLGRRLTLVSTPLGTIVVVICLDAFAPHVRERLVRSPAEVLLVPSLSPSIRRHRDSLQQLVQVLWGVAFVCNRSPYGVDSPLNKEKLSPWNDESNRSFWVVQRDSLDPPEAKDPDAHPSFVFHLDAIHDGDQNE